MKNPTLLALNARRLETPFMYRHNGWHTITRVEVGLMAHFFSFSRLIGRRHKSTRIKVQATLKEILN